MFSRPPSRYHCDSFHQETDTYFLPQRRFSKKEFLLNPIRLPKMVPNPGKYLDIFFQLNISDPKYLLN